MTAIRRGATQLMDVIGDAVNALMLLIALVAAWKCWHAFFGYWHETGGLAAIPRSALEWKALGQGVYAMLLNDVQRPLLLHKAQGWPMAWFTLVLAVALSAIAVAGLRWAWIRLRDAVAGA